jgi:hypothetical protein
MIQIFEGTNREIPEKPKPSKKHEALRVPAQMMVYYKALRVLFSPLPIVSVLLYLVMISGFAQFV